MQTIIGLKVRRNPEICRVMTILDLFSILPGHTFPTFGVQMTVYKSVESPSPNVKGNSRFLKNSRVWGLGFRV